MPLPFEIQRLLPRHHQMLQLALQGYGPTEVAQSLGMTKESVSIIMRSPLFQSALGRLRREQETALVENEAETTQRARTTLENASVRAAERQVALLEAESEKVQLAAADSILDRVLGKTSPEATGSIVINAQTVQLLQHAIAESFGTSPPAVAIEATNG